MKRSEDWVIRLEAFLRARTSEPFQWGRNDCCLFAADAVYAMTGEDLAYHYRGTYKDKEAARRLLLSLGGGGVELLARTVAEDWNLERIEVLNARRGDVVLVKTALGSTLGIVTLDGWNCVGPGEYGMHRFELRECSQAWRIP